jgi:hypothetical protein
VHDVRSTRIALDVVEQWRAAGADAPPLDRTVSARKMES